MSLNEFKGGVSLMYRGHRRRKYKLSGDLSVYTKRRLKLTKVHGL